MSNSQFVYVVYIRTTPEKLWQALTEPEFTRQFWFGVWQDSEWKPGASWKMVFPDGRAGDSGEVLEIEPPQRLVLKWRHELKPELRAEGYSRCTYELEKQHDYVKLTITHQMEEEKPVSKFIDAVSGGWPIILSSLKSLLETGKALDSTDRYSKSA